MQFVRIFMRLTCEHARNATPPSGRTASVWESSLPDFPSTRQLFCRIRAHPFAPRVCTLINGNISGSWVMILNETIMNGVEYSKEQGQNVHGMWIVPGVLLWMCMLRINRACWDQPSLEGVTDEKLREFRVLLEKIVSSIDRTDN